MTEEVDEQHGIEQRLDLAISSRLQHFRDQASSLTMASVRRLLENDMELGEYALDEHKGLVRHYLDKVMGVNGDDKSLVDLKGREKDEPSSIGEARDVKESDTGNEDSPVKDILTPKSERGLQGSPLSESKIEKALWERADYFCANSEEISMAGVRRLLEDDLGLDKGTLDAFKKFISQKLDLVLSAPEDVKKHASREKISRKKGSDDSPDNGMVDAAAKKPRKVTASGRKNKKSEPAEKRKAVSEERDHLGASGKKSKKLTKRSKEDAVKKPPSAVKKPAQIREITAAGYGKRVENLKSIIKACGMSIPPSIYRKAKQVPDDERESVLVSELEGILSKEGMSRNPSEKEIKECRKKKQTAKELEGIDTSNIITSSRRRSAFSFEAPTPKTRRVDDETKRRSSEEDENAEDDTDDSEEKDEAETKKKKKKIQDAEKSDEDEDENDEFNEDGSD